MGIISRGTKTGSPSTDFADGTVIEADEMNVDFNTMYTEFNGQIDDDNLAANSVGNSELQAGAVTDNEVAAGANIDPDKLDQTAGGLDSTVVDAHADGPADYFLVTDPGTTDASSQPTNLDEEWERSRYVAGRNATGVSVLRENGVVSAWIEPPARWVDHVYNGSFCVWVAGTSPSSSVDGWGAKGAPTFTITTTGISEGFGNDLNIVGGTGEGIAQQVTGLKASTKYLAVCRLQVNGAGDTIQFQTDGADAASNYSNLDLASTTTGSYETLAGVVQTDAAATDITVQTVGTAAADDWDVRAIHLFEMVEDVRVLPPSVVAFDQEAVGLTLSYIPTVAAAVPNLTVTVTPPGPGYIVKVTANYSIDDISGSGPCTITLVENGSTTRDTQYIGNNNGQSAGVSLIYATFNPTPGVALTYTIEHVSGSTRNVDNASASIMVSLERGS